MKGNRNSLESREVKSQPFWSVTLRLPNSPRSQFSFAVALAKWRPGKWFPIGGKHLKMVRPVRPLEGPDNFLGGSDFE